MIIRMQLILLEVTLISGAIAFGILVSEIVYYIYSRIKQSYGKIKGKTYKNPII